MNLYLGSKYPSHPIRIGAGFLWLTLAAWRAALRYRQSRLPIQISARHGDAACFTPTSSDRLTACSLNPYHICTFQTPVILLIILLHFGVLDLCTSMIPLQILLYSCRKKYWGNISGCCPCRASVFIPRIPSWRLQ